MVIFSFCLITQWNLLVVRELVFFSCLQRALRYRLPIGGFPEQNQTPTSSTFILETPLFSKPISDIKSVRARAMLSLVWVRRRELTYNLCILIGLTNRLAIVPYILSQLAMHWQLPMLIACVLCSLGHDAQTKTLIV